MKLFPTGHATHPQWRMAAGLVLAQLRAQMALADYALYAAILASIGPVALAVTTNLSFNFLRKPGPTGLVAEAHLLKLGRRLAVGEVAITAPDSQELVCHATGTYAIPPER